MLAKSRLCFLLIILTLPNFVMADSNNELFWGIREGDSLNYNLKSSKLNEPIGVQLIVKELPEISKIVQDPVDIPLAEIEVHSGNSTYAALNKLVYIPDWITSWKQLFIVLPLGNFSLLENIEANQQAPVGTTFLWTLNETEISWGSIMEINGYGYYSKIKESYSTTDGALLEYSFEYEDLFVVSNFTLERSNIKDIMAAYIFQMNAVNWTIFGGCMIIPVVLLIQWIRINWTVKKVVSKE
jgi:hypothetical protein